MQFFSAIFLIAITSVSFSSPNQQKELQTTPVFQEPTSFIFPNGVTLIVEEDRNTPIVSVQAWCKAGSIYETPLGGGMSHVLEHMLLFKGTKKRSPGVAVQEVRRSGGYINGFTSSNKTVYVIETSSEAASNAVDILADMMMNSTLPIQEYKKEQEVIRREIARNHDSPDRMSGELLFRTAFQASPFCEPVVGHLHVYNKLTRDEVMAYYKRRYIPNNLCFIVVGNVDAQKIKQQLFDFFEKYPSQPLDSVFVQEEPPQLGKRIGQDTFLGKLSHLYVAWRIPNQTNQDLPALHVLATILGSGASAVLKKVIYEQKELVDEIGAGLCEPQGLFYISAVADAKKKEAVEAAILEQVELLKKKSVTTAMLEKAKKKILAEYCSSLATTYGRASHYGESWIATGNSCFKQKYFDLIKEVTSEQVKSSAVRYLVDDSLIITTLDPPASPSSLANNLTDKKEEGSVVPQIQKRVLSNGLSLLVCEDHRLPLVSMTALFRGGVLSEDLKCSGLTHLLASTMVKGTHSKTSEQLADQLEQVGGSMKALAEGDSFGVSLEVMNPDFNVGFALLADMLTQATFAPAEVNREKKSQLAFIRSEDDQIMNVAKTNLRSKLFGVHPYGRSALGTVESVTALTPEVLQKAYKELVVGSNGVVAIVGDVKAEEVFAMATKIFASMPTGTKAFSLVPMPTTRTAPIEEHIIRPREQTIIMKGFLGTTMTSPDRPALELLSAVCNNAGSRFFNQMRDKMALVYFIGTVNEIGFTPGSFTFYLGVDPEKVGEARDELNREINNLVAQGLTQAELDEAKKKLLSMEASSNQSYANVANCVAKDELMGLGFHHTYYRAEELNQVTLEIMNHIIKKYLGVPGSVEVMVGPYFSKSLLQKRKS